MSIGVHLRLNTILKIDIFIFQTRSKKLFENSNFQIKEKK